MHLYPQLQSQPHLRGSFHDAAAEPEPEPEQEATDAPSPDYEPGEEPAPEQEPEAQPEAGDRRQECGSGFILKQNTKSIALFSLSSH